MFYCKFRRKGFFCNEELRVVQINDFGIFPVEMYLNVVETLNNVVETHDNIVETHRSASLHA